MTDRRALLAALTGRNYSNPCQAAGQARHAHYGRVVAISGSRVDVNLDGATTPTPNLATSALYSPTLDDYVRVDHENDVFVVAHHITG